MIIAESGETTPESDFHIGECEVNLFLALIGNGEVCEDYINLCSLEELYTACSLNGNELQLNAEVLCDTVCKINIVALEFAVVVNVAKWVLIQ